MMPGPTKITLDQASFKALASARPGGHPKAPGRAPPDGPRPEKPHGPQKADPPRTPRKAPERGPREAHRRGPQVDLLRAHGQGEEDPPPGARVDRRRPEQRGGPRGGRDVLHARRGRGGAPRRGGRAPRVRGGPG